MSQPPSDIPVTAISIEYIPYIEHMMHKLEYSAL